jgi:hypothetical protein
VFGIDGTTFFPGNVSNTPIGGIDAFTKLMLHMNGTNGSTTFTDSELTPKTITAFGDAQISTAQSKFNGSSGLFDGTDDYVTAADSADFNFAAGDFTIDFWMRPIAQTDAALYHQREGVGNGEVYILWQGTTDQKVYFFANTTLAVTVADIRTTGTVSLPNDTWNHVAFVRNGATPLFFIGGVSQTLTTVTAFGTLPDLADDPRIGAYKSATPILEYNGYLAEYRVSKGIARWTANFTPPAGPYTTV